MSKIPAHWKMVRLKYGFDIIGSGTTPPTGEASYYDGDVPWVTTSELRENVIETTNQRITRNALNELTALRIYPVGSVLFAMYGATIGRVALLGIEATVNQAVCVLAYSSLLNSRFAFYVLQASRDELVSSASGGGQPNLNAERVREHRVTCPPMAEQRAIADYLDLEMARLDALVAEKERLLRLLAEKRRALITRTVTRGLDPHAPLRDSGIPWLGEIPAHWELKRLKHIGQAIIGLTFDPADTVNDGSGVIVLRASNVRGQKIILEDNVFVLMDIPEILRTRMGDILICSRSGSRALIGKNALIDQASAGLTFGAFMTVFRSPCNEYLFYIFNSPLFDYQAGAFSTSTINQLTVETLNGMEVPLPPLSEQKAIVASLRERTSRLDHLVEATDQTIALLKERRAALIAAAVTGQIDVRSRP